MMIDLSRADEDFLTDRYKDWLQVASREFRKGFMDGLECNCQKYPATDMYLSGYADGYALTQMRDASQHAGETL
jgi:hypothetical protein